MVSIHQIEEKNSWKESASENTEILHVQLRSKANATSSEVRKSVQPTNKLNSKLIGTETEQQVCNYFLLYLLETIFNYLIAILDNFFVAPFSFYERQFVACCHITTPYARSVGIGGFPIAQCVWDEISGALVRGRRESRTTAIISTGPAFLRPISLLTEQEKYVCCVFYIFSDFRVFVCVRISLTDPIRSQFAQW